MILKIIQTALQVRCEEQNKWFSLFGLCAQTLVCVSCAAGTWGAEFHRSLDDSTWTQRSNSAT